MINIIVTAVVAGLIATGLYCAFQIDKIDRSNAREN